MTKQQLAKLALKYKGTAKGNKYAQQVLRKTAAAKDLKSAVKLALQQLSKYTSKDLKNKKIAEDIFIQAYPNGIADASTMSEDVKEAMPITVQIETEFGVGEEMERNESQVLKMMEDETIASETFEQEHQGTFEINAFVEQISILAVEDNLTNIDVYLIYQVNPIHWLQL